MWIRECATPFLGSGEKSFLNRGLIWLQRPRDAVGPGLGG